jgi:hypothetical protein
MLFRVLNKIPLPVHSRNIAVWKEARNPLDFVKWQAREAGFSSSQMEMVSTENTTELQTIRLDLCGNRIHKYVCPSLTYKFEKSTFRFPACSNTEAELPSGLHSQQCYNCTESPYSPLPGSSCFCYLLMEYLNILSFN